MKAFLISILIFFIMISGGIAGEYFLKDVSKNLEEYSQSIKTLALDGRYDELENTYEEIKEYWKKKKKTLSALIDHSHMCEIDKSLSELEAALEAQESSEVLLASARVKTIIETVAKNEQFHLNNIL